MRSPILTTLYYDDHDFVSYWNLYTVRICGYFREKIPLIPELLTKLLYSRFANWIVLRGFWNEVMIHILNLEKYKLICYSSTVDRLFYSPPEKIMFFVEKKQSCFGKIRIYILLFTHTHIKRIVNKMLNQSMYCSY